MAEREQTPLTMAEFEALEARTHVPFEKLTYAEPEPPAETVHDEYDRQVRRVLFDSPG